MNTASYYNEYLYTLFPNCTFACSVGIPKHKIFHRPANAAVCKEIRATNSKECGFRYSSRKPMQKT